MNMTRKLQDKVLFPAPEGSYSSESAYQSVIYVPRNVMKLGQPRTIEHIPCLYIPAQDGADKLALYFHGNSEDIGLAFDLLLNFG
jgi:hypothetical protein